MDLGVALGVVSVVLGIVSVVVCRDQLKADLFGLADKYVAWRRAVTDPRSTRSQIRHGLLEVVRAVHGAPTPLQRRVAGGLAAIGAVITKLEPTLRAEDVTAMMVEIRVSGANRVHAIWGLLSSLAPSRAVSPQTAMAGSVVAFACSVVAFAIAGDLMSATGALFGAAFFFVGLMTLLRDELPMLPVIGVGVWALTSLFLDLGWRHGDNAAFHTSRLGLTLIAAWVPLCVIRTHLAPKVLERFGATMVSPYMPTRANDDEPAAIEVLMSRWLIFSTVPTVALIAGAGLLLLATAIEVASAAMTVPFAVAVVCNMAGIVAGTYAYVIAIDQPRARLSTAD